MKFLVISVASLASTVLAAPGGFKYIRADLKKRTIEDDSAQQLMRRGMINTPLYNQVQFYQIDMDVGNPPQKLSALLDTGSSDMWFFSSGVPGATAHFNPRQSSTWQNNNTQFTIGYVSGNARGTWGTDDVSISGAKIKKQSFALVTQGNGLSGLPGLIGVGLPALESTNVNYNFLGGPKRTYSNVPISLFEQGHITTPTYSMFLDNIDATAGTVLFGAIDHSKYKGTLYSVPRVHNSRFNVNVDNFSVNGQSIGSIGSATLDSGTTLGSLPDSIINSLARSLRLQQSQGVYYARKNSYNPNTPISFSISGAQFNLKMGDLFVDSEKLGDSFPKGLSVFGFTPASTTQNQIILGDVFLRNFYIVYDLAHPQIGVALANFDHKNKSNMEPIVTSTIPKARLVTASPAGNSASSSNTQSAYRNSSGNIFGWLTGGLRNLFPSSYQSALINFRNSLASKTTSFAASIAPSSLNFNDKNSEDPAAISEPSVIPYPSTMNMEDGEPRINIVDLQNSFSGQPNQLNLVDLDSSYRSEH